jgi:GT2 family glycosyltransferase
LAQHYQEERLLKISLLILTQNRWQDLSRCLSSLKNLAPFLAEILVLDNGSDSPLSDSIKAMFPQVRFLRSEENLGVARGRNRLAMEAQSDLLWFLDDDAEIGNLEYLKIIDDYFKNGDIYLVSFKVINRLAFQEETRGIPHKDKLIFSEDRPSAYFNGCSFVVRRTVFLSGLTFWNDLHYSGEELGLSYQMLEKDFKIINSAKLWVFHNYQDSPLKRKSYIYFNARNRPWLALRYLPWRNAFTNSFFWWSYLGFQALRLGEFKIFLKGVRDSLKFFKTIVTELREPVSAETLALLKLLGGRLWY